MGQKLEANKLCSQYSCNTTHHILILHVRFLLL